ncbi:fungal fruit body lectin [Aspergillus cavernicola]|uniref:Fungal fruit body lectin n=1 Tax=Aspergillus cavernicola TaxID=176166 RepID=A0ABR4HM98_9EURO
MSYTINVRFESESDALTVVEKTCWHYANGGLWTENEGHHHLTMGGSGTSGMLRFKTTSGELFSIIVGVHNYAPWCDVQVNLVGHDTGVKLNPEYYGGGRLSAEAHKEIERTTSQGHHVKLHFHQIEGHNISAVLHYN